MDEMLAEVALPGDVCLMKIDVEGGSPVLLWLIGPARVRCPRSCSTEPVLLPSRANHTSPPVCPPLAAGREPSVVLSAPRLFNATRVRHVMLEFSPGFGEDGSPGLADMLRWECVGVGVRLQAGVPSSGCALGRGVGAALHGWRSKTGASCPASTLPAPAARPKPTHPPHAALLAVACTT